METKDIVIGLTIGLFVGLLVGGGIFYFRQPGDSQSNDEGEITSFPTSEPMEEEIEDEVSPTAEPTQAVNKEDLTIQVLNGSGTAGMAGDGQDYLEELGYENISVGNADSYDYEKTEVYLKEEMKGTLETLIEDLNEKYEVEVQSEYLEEDADYDIQIIIGAN